jgi:hypothetical protein
VHLAPIIVLVVGLLVVAAVGILVVGSNDRRANESGAPPVTWPATWDTRVGFAVDFVEREKGKPFEHPVNVVFQDDATFEKDLTAHPDLSDEDRTEATQGAGMLRAFGMAKGDLDLVAEGESLARSSVLAYYDNTTVTIKIRGTELDTEVKATVVHELTHAWQDQYHDLGRLDDIEESEPAFALRSVVEGDAERVRHAWIEQLPASQRDEFDDEGAESAAADEGQAADEGSPFLTFKMGAPYILGPLFLDGVDADGGADAVDRALETPPPDSAAIMQPWMNGHERARATTTLPPLTSGRSEIMQDSIGGLDLYLMLADRIDPHVALKAADAWAGDRFRLVTVDGGDVCVEGRIQAYDAGGARDLATAMTQWDTAFKNGKVTLHPDDSGVTYEACDPGKDAAIDVPGRPSQTIGLVALRQQLWAQTREAGAPAAAAECGAKAFVDMVTLEELASKEPLPLARQQELQRSMLRACPR